MTGVLGTEEITYERAKELARSDDPAVRAALAERADVAPELLYFLAEDASADVRRAVAGNQAAPRQTDLLLAHDADEDVRGGLAAKIATVAPNLSADETNKVYAQTYEALETLASDQITKVRALLSEALKEVVDAPPEIIKTLAQDLEIEVSGPVLEFSRSLPTRTLLKFLIAALRQAVWRQLLAVIMFPKISRMPSSEQMTLKALQICLATTLRKFARMRSTI